MAQHRAAAGETHSQIMQRMLITTPAILTNHYLPEGRHDNGIKRLSACQATGAVQ